MENQIQVFSNENFGSVRVLGDSNNPLFCLADVCKVLEIQNTSDVKNALIKEFGDDLDKIYPISDSMGREQNAIFIQERELYFVLMRSNKENVKPFRKWVFEEVLPSIRKNGSYDLAQQYKIPQTYAEALLEAGRLALENEKLIAKAKEDAPKVQCFNELMNSKNAIDFMEFSKIIGIGRTKLFAKCRELGVLMQSNRPYQTFIDNGCFRVIESTYTQGDMTRSYTKTMILPKGQAYLTKKLKGAE